MLEIPRDNTHDAGEAGPRHPVDGASDRLAGRSTLALISDARQALAEARTLPDIRRVMEAASVAADAGRRAAKLAKAQGLAADVARDAEAAARDAAAVRIEAQAKASELLREMAERGDTTSHGGDRRSGSRSRPATLKDLGVTKSESSLWQRVASVPAEVRAEYVEETKAAGGEVTTDGLLKHAEQAEWEAAQRNDAEAMAVLDRIDPEGAVRQQQAKLVATWATAQARLSHAVTTSYRSTSTRSCRCWTSSTGAPCRSASTTSATTPRPWSGRWRRPGRCR